MYPALLRAPYEYTRHDAPYLSLSLTLWNGGLASGLIWPRIPPCPDRRAVDWATEALSSSPVEVSVISPSQEVRRAG